MIENENKIILKISTVGIAGNVILSAFKLVAGVVGHSSAMISDAIHSLSDVFATLIAWFGVHESHKEADAEHPYGHERIECIASLSLGLILIGTGAGIGFAAILKIIHHDYSAPALIALIAAVVSIVVKEGVFWYTRHYARILNSDAFMADAWHHRSDALSSIGSLIGIGGAMLGFPIMDPLASLVICVFIFKVAIDIIRDAFAKMIDTSCGEEYEQAVVDYVLGFDGVERLDLIHTRLFGSMVYMDVEIAVDGNLPLVDAHEIAENVHDGIETRFENIKHVMIHVNPA